ncbi:ATP-binding protein [Tateyamaria omphalii]|uniref:Serine/threonine protein kinase n=1 Tax=Tateyamaria omphalii TaxID=299262 RepID=A0A1P8N1D2_9RHOB|nr:ATP-binding protein [Tateyamaria omphalii]APX13989.1 serine/threonine protein kinase [Tateyamaria omphalii]
MTQTTFLPAFHISVVSGQLAVRQALAQLLDGLKPLALDVEEAGTVELVMAEALNNIVEHAYPETDADGPISITCAHQKDGLHLTVVDSGRAMPDGQTPVGTAADIDVDLCDMPEGGFGWFLIKDLAKDVTYKRHNAQNQLRLRLAVALA